MPTFDSFEVYADHFAFADREPGVVVAGVRINGTDLRVLLMDALRPMLTAEHAAGRRGSGSLEELLDPFEYDAFLPMRDVAPPSQHWLGAPDPYYDEDGRAAVLTCSCGIFGCGGVTAQIELQSYYVSWSDFHGANGGDVIPLREFRFLRHAYEREIQELSAD